MTSAAPTILAIETDSAWVVIFAVSLVTLVATLLLRRLIGRPGGTASGVLLVLPLVLPLVAAVVFEQAVLPELRVMRPIDSALFTASDELFHFLLLSDGRGNSIPYALTGSAGPWLVVFGIAVSSFMLVRRALGAIVVGRLISKCCPPLDHEGRRLQELVETLGVRAGLRRTPELLMLPERFAGAFAVGARRPRILISSELIEALDDDELEAILAHEVAHLAARDLAVVSVAGVLRDVVAWNPIAHMSLRRLVLDRELEADRRAAELTRKPLAVASGLLKMCDVVRSCNRSRFVPVLGFLRSSGLIKRRVAQLVALADGPAIAPSTRHLPYLMAAALVAFVGLQAGARLAQDASALAIVVGETEAELFTPTPLPPRGLRRAEKVPSVTKTKGPGTRSLDLAALRSPALLGRMAIPDKDIPRWVREMKRSVAGTLGVNPATLRWQARDSWTAQPMAGLSLGIRIGIYRIEQTTFGLR